MASSHKKTNKKIDAKSEGILFWLSDKEGPQGLSTIALGTYSHIKTVQRKLDKLKGNGFVSQESKGAGYFITEEGKKIITIKHDHVRIEDSIEIAKSRQEFRNKFQVLMNTPKITQESNLVIIYSHGDIDAYEKALETIHRSITDFCKIGKIYWISHTNTQKIFREFKLKYNITTLYNFYFDVDSPAGLSSVAVIARRNGGALISNIFSSGGLGYYMKAPKVSDDIFHMLKSMWVAFQITGHLKEDAKNEYEDEKIKKSIKELANYSKIEEELGNLADTPEKDLKLNEVMKKVEVLYYDMKIGRAAILELIKRL